MKKICLIYLLLLNVLVLYAQYDDPYQYYPMATGNYWYYSSGPGYYYSEKIYADSTDNTGNRFFWISTRYTGDKPIYGIDTTYFFILKPTSNSKSRYYYKLDAEIGDWWWVWRGDSSDTTIGTWCEVSDIYDGYYLGVETRFKVYAFNIRTRENNEYHDYWDHNVILAYGIGRVYQDNDANYPYNLLGAIIDGKVIGNPVSIEENLAEELPNNFELYQNYPNPFNPSTTIKFQLPTSGNVKLSLFNMLGEKITDLLDGYKIAGTYQLQIDLSKYQLSTGIYLYLINYNNQRICKKMMYLK